MREDGGIRALYSTTEFRDHNCTRKLVELKEVRARHVVVCSRRMPVRRTHAFGTSMYCVLRVVEP